MTSLFKRKWVMFLKRIVILLCLGFVILSLSKDLGKINSSGKVGANVSETAPIYYVKLEADVGDTMLTLVERVNGKLFYTLPMERIKEDFERLNPSYEVVLPQQKYKVPYYVEELGLHH